MDKKILLLGPKYAKDSSLVGGVVVLFEQLLEDLQTQNITYHVIDTNGKNYPNKISTYLQVITNFFKTYKKYDHISLHGTVSDYMFLAPIVIFFAKRSKKSVSLRKFAGGFADYYNQGGYFRQKVIKYIIKNADINFFETKELVAFFKKFNKKTFWFPNVRKCVSSDFEPKEYEKKFIFIGGINKEKGIDELMQVSNRLDKDYTIDLYGKIFESDYTKDELLKSNLNYKGILKPNEVVDVIKKYDVLVLPSHREGYPGVIIEAFMAGRPVLSTTLPSIKEMVQNRQNGVLVEPKNIDSLFEGFIYFDSKNYSNLAQKSFNSFKEYDSLIQTKKFLNLVEKL